MLAWPARATTKGGVRGKVERRRVRGNSLPCPFLFGAALAARSRGFVAATKKRGFWWLRWRRGACGALGARTESGFSVSASLRVLQKSVVWWLRRRHGACGALAARRPGPFPRRQRRLRINGARTGATARARPSAVNTIGTAARICSADHAELIISAASAAIPSSSPAGLEVPAARPHSCIRVR